MKNANSQYFFNFMGLRKRVIQQIKIQPLYGWTGTYIKYILIN